MCILSYSRTCVVAVVCNNATLPAHFFCQKLASKRKTYIRYWPSQRVQARTVEKRRTKQIQILIIKRKQTIEKEHVTRCSIRADMHTIRTLCESPIDRYPFSFSPWMPYSHPFLTILYNYTHIVHVCQ